MLATDPAAALKEVDLALRIGERTGLIKAPAGPSSTVGKLRADLAAGRITQEDFDDQITTFDKKMALKKGGRAITNVDARTTIENKGLTAEQEALARNRAGRFDTIMQDAITAEEQNAGLSQLRNIDIETGFGEGTKAGFARVLNAFGADGDQLLGVDTANVQAFNKLTGKLVLNVMSTQKGPQTDADQARIAKTLPNIADEQLAREFNLNSLEALNLRKIEMAGFYEDYLEENETLKGANKAWGEFKRKTPLLSDTVKNKETGLPMFFHEFKRKAIEHNPGATEEQILDAWRELANG